MGKVYLPNKKHGGCGESSQELLLIRRERPPVSRETRLLDSWPSDTQGPMAFTFHQQGAIEYLWTLPGLEGPTWVLAP